MEEYNGEKCWSYDEAMDELYIDDDDTMDRFLLEGIPHYKKNIDGEDALFFPIDKVHAWFRGEYAEPKKTRPRGRAIKCVALKYQLVEELMNEKGLRRKDMYTMASLPSTSTLSRVKLGKKITLPVAEDIAAVLGVPVQDLIVEE